MSHAKTAVSFILFFLVTFGVLQLAFMYYETRNESMLQQTLLNEVSDKAQNLHIRLTDSLTALNTMESILAMEDYKTDRFDFWGRAILEENPKVSAVQLAPGGVVQNVIPLQGNEKAVGHDLLADSRRDSGAKKTIQSRGITFVGPLRLIQNGRMAVIARKPVFKSSEGNQSFWGFVIVLIELDNLINSEERPDSDKSVAWRLLGQDPDKNQGTERPLIAESPNAGSVTSWDASYDIPVPNGSWQMQMAYNDTPRLTFMLGQSLVLLLAALFSAIFIIQQIRVAKRNDKLTASEWKAKQERKQLLSVLDSIPEMIYVADFETYEVVFANRKLKEALGKDIVGEKCFQAMQGKDQKCDNCVFDSAAGCTIPKFSEEYRPVFKKHFYVMNRAIQWTESRKARFQLAVDITQRIQFEKQLKKSEAKYRLIAENATDVIFIFNVQNMKFTYFSPAIYTLRGYSPEEAMQQSLEQCLTPESAQRTHARIAEVLPKYYDDPDSVSQEVYYNELQQPCKDGSVVWIETTTRYRTNEEGEVEIIGIARNIDERKKHQNILAQRLRYEEYLAKISNSLMLNHPGVLDTCLQYLLEARQCSRVYIFENFVDQENQLAFRQTHEVCAPGVSSELDNPDLQHLVYERDGFARWKEELSQNRIVAGNVSSFPEAERVLLESQDIQSILAIPIHVHREWFGFVGFDETSEEKDWNDEDVNLLRTAAEIIGLYFERTRTEQSLKASEERFRLAFENANDGVCIVALDGKLVQVNQRMSDIFGYSRRELESKTVMDISHPEDRNVSPRFIERNLAGDVVNSVFEKRYIHKDGHVVWGQVSSSLVRDEHGEPLHFVSHVQDISYRKEMEEALSQSEARYRLLAENAADAIWTMDERQNFTFVSPSFERLFGYTLEELGKGLPEGLIPEHSRQSIMEHVARRVRSVEQGNPDHTPYCIVLEQYAKGGRHLWIEATTTPIYDEHGAYKGVVGVSRDISERKIADMELQKRSRAMENSPASIVITDAAGRIEYVNPAFVEETGYTREEVLGRSPRILKSGLHDQEFYADLWQAITSGQSWQGEICNKRKNGELYWEQALISAVMDEHGNITNYVAVKGNITDRKNLEQLKEDVDRMMRHDLKGPLNGIIGLPQVLIMSGGLSPDQISMLENIESAGQDMLHMIDLSLDLFKMETGRYTFFPQTVDVIEVLARLAEQKKQEILSLGLSLEVTLDDAPLEQNASLLVQSQRRLLYSMLANLLTNAIEASPKGSVIEIRLQQGDPTVIAIRNTGAVPRAIRETFFQKYSTYGKQRGTGLGTYSAKVIADAMGHELQMQAWDEEDTTEVRVLVYAGAQ